MTDKCKADNDGNCQHAVSTGNRSWTIPSGTHIIGGRTVSVAGSLDSVDTNHPKDELAKELLKILGVESPEQYVDNKAKFLLEDLVMYIVDRDDKILEHGIELGWKQSTVHIEKEVNRIIKERGL